MAAATAVIAGTCFLASKKRQAGKGATAIAVEETAADTKVPPREGSRGCLSIRQLLYLAEFVDVKGNAVVGLKSEKAVDKFMTSMYYEKAKARFKERDGLQTCYSHDCSLDEMGSMTAAKSDDASVVMISSGGQPGTSWVVSMTVKSRKAYDELLMQMYALNYYQTDEGSFHKDGGRFKIFPSQLLDDNGYEVDIYLD